ncbi:hypothetical protein MKY34_05270 [Sporosarcina sp. FSL K6-1522]|uniref:hypothetical protein n=1 Tax=Sporosarcina sp. FSL K6-1522 TaxID=2921554 RepID=UPI00315A4828
MKGSHLVIGLVILIVAVVAAIYFTMTATFKQGDAGLESVVSVVEVIEDWSWAE